MYVIIAEKPSVAKNIADALNIRNRQNGFFEGADYLITWAFGHLLQLYDSKDYDEKMAKWKLNNFPFIPERFKYKVKSDIKNKNKPDKGASIQLSIIKKLINRKDVSGVISACDFDREGQIIGDIILNYLRVKKPIKRLLLNEWTPEEVLSGLNNLKPNAELKPVSDAGICRQWTDWTIGINLTSVATLKYKKTKGPLNIGRVLLPTLKIIYDRDKEIENFISKDFFKLNGAFGTLNNKEYKGMFYFKGKDRFDSRKDLEKILNEMVGKAATIVKKETERKREHPPLLFNLSNLQGHITSKYNGWTSDKVLRVAQSLYEKKFITYPRTASVALEESLKERTKRVLDVLKVGLPYEKEISFTESSRVFNNRKVDGHSAIIPTYLIPTKLTKDEKIVYKEIKDRFIMQFMPISEYDETNIETKIDDNPIDGLFITKGKILKVEGWKKVQGANVKEVVLPEVSLNEKVDVKELNISSHKTKPPAYHNEKTLLRVMETCGRGYKEKGGDEDLMMHSVLRGFSIGTPATRADTIKRLKTVGYIRNKGRFLTSTNLGQSLVENFPIKELFDLEYTGRLEKTLAEIEEGKRLKDDFLDFIFKFTRESVEKIKNDGGVLMAEENLNGVEEKDEAIGLCPECGEPVVESLKVFGCSDWRNGCKFGIWKDDKYLASMKKKPTKTMVRSILANGETLVKGLISKKGNKFDAILGYSKDKETGYYRWSMRFPDRES